jgi:alpha-D-ribose 1-methylphosphonate 5-triphosphate diphosphatase
MHPPHRRAGGPAALIRNKIHLRFEITNYKAVDLIRGLVFDGLVDLLSFMDHTPGQGQYPTVESYRRYMEKTYHSTIDEIEKILAVKTEGRTRAEESIGVLATAAKAAGVPLASHDDDDAAKIEYYKYQGRHRQRVPDHCLAAAKVARGLGIDVIVSVRPNIVRGGSTATAWRRSTP